MAWNDWLYSNTGMDDFMRAGRQIQNQGFNALGTGDFWQSLGAGLGEAGIAALSVIPPVGAAARATQAGMLAGRGLLPTGKSAASAAGKNLYNTYFGKVNFNKYPKLNKLNKGGILTGGKRALSTALVGSQIAPIAMGSTQKATTQPTTDKSTVPFETKYWNDYTQNLMNIQNQANIEDENKMIQSLLTGGQGVGGGSGGNGVANLQRQAALDALKRQLGLDLTAVGMQRAGVSQDMGTALSQFGMDTSPASYDVAMQDAIQQATLQEMAARDKFAKGMGEAESAYRNKVAGDAAASVAEQNALQLQQLKTLATLLGGYNG